MPTGIPHSDEFRLNACEKALKAKIEDGISFQKTAEELGISASLLGGWIKKHENNVDEKKLESVIDAIEPEFNPEIESENDGIFIINDEYRRETVAASLVMSGYVVWLTANGGNHYINYQAQ